MIAIDSQKVDIVQNCPCIVLPKAIWIVDCFCNFFSKAIWIVNCFCNLLPIAKAIWIVSFGVGTQHDVWMLIYFCALVPGVQA